MTDNKIKKIKDNNLPFTSSSTNFSSISQILKKYKSQEIYSIKPRKFESPVSKQGALQGTNSIQNIIICSTATKANSKNNSQTNIISLHSMAQNKKAQKYKRDRLNSPNHLLDNPPLISPSYGTRRDSQTKKIQTSLAKILSDGSFQELDTEGNIEYTQQQEDDDSLSEEKSPMSSNGSERYQPALTENNQRTDRLNHKIKINPFRIQNSRLTKENDPLLTQEVSHPSDHFQRQLLSSAKKGDKEAFLEYLEKIFALPNGNVNYCDESKCTALHYACEEGNLKIVEILIKANCDINARNTNMKTALHIASSNGYFDISKLLIENGCNINQVDNEKNNPIHLCASNGHIELLKYFLDKLPQADFKNIYGKTPYDLATKIEIKQLLNDYKMKNEGKFHKVKIETTTDQHLVKMFQTMNNTNSNNRTVKTAQKAISNRGIYQNNTNRININIQGSNNSNKSTGNKTNKVNVTVKTDYDNKPIQNDNIPKSTCNRTAPKLVNGNFNKKQSHNNISPSKKTIIKPASAQQNQTIYYQTHENTKIAIRSVNSNDQLRKTKTLSNFNNTKIKNKQVILKAKTNDITIKYEPKNEETQFNHSTDNFYLNKTEDGRKNKQNPINTTTNNNNNSNDEAESLLSQINLNSIEEEKVTPTSFQCLALLGRGSFGEVYLVEKTNTNNLYAMKVLSKDKITSQNLLKYAMAERNVLSLTNHPFIVHLNYAFQTCNKLFLILDYCENGDLSKHLYHEKRFTEERAKFYLCELILALEDLHKRDVIYRDLKPDNVVLDEDGHAQLTDFGLSREGVFDSNCAKSFCGSIAYLAPEMLKRQGHGKAVDWYLLGVLFYEMLIGIPPFFTDQKEEIFRNIEHAELQIPKFVSKEASAFLKLLLQKDPNKRLGGGETDADEVKGHIYLSNVDWNSVYEKKIPPPRLNKFSNAIQPYSRPRMFQTEEENGIHKDAHFDNWSFVQND